MPASRSFTLLLSLLALLVSGIACGTAASTAESTPSETPPPAVIATTAPTATLAPTTPVRVRTSVQASCRLTYYGAELTLSYSAVTETEGRMTRVRLLMNGRLEQDSGGILQTDFRGEGVFEVGAGGRHMFQVIINTTGPQPATAWSFARCPDAPDPKALAPGLTSRNGWLS